MAHERKCRCGSGQNQWALHDAAGTFVTYVCDACVAEKKKGYNPAIFRPATNYARTGDEEDLW